MSFITLKNINKSFNGEPVLKNINLELNEGSTLGILGRSGSGKSVLINMLRGIKEYAPDSGEVIFNIAMCENKDWIGKSCYKKKNLHHASEKLCIIR